MGMYSYIALRVWVHAEKRPAYQDETQTIIQALYDNKKINVKLLAQNAFDLNGDSIDAVPWYNVEKHISSFSRQYPDYSFILYQKSAEPEDKTIDFKVFYQNKYYHINDYFMDIWGDNIFFNKYEIFNPSFTLCKDIEDLKQKVNIRQTDDYLYLSIHTSQQHKIDRINRILNDYLYRNQTYIQQLGFSHAASDFLMKKEVQFYIKLNDLTEHNKTPQDFIDFFYQVAEQNLVGKLL